MRRYPAREEHRWRIFSWARGYRDDFVHVVERHLQTGIIPADAEFPQAPQWDGPPSSPSVVASEARGSTPREAVSITDSATPPRPSSSGESGEEQVSRSSLNSDHALDENGVLVRVDPASPSDLPRGPPVPRPVNEPMGMPDGQAVTEEQQEEPLTDFQRALRGERLGIWRDTAEDPEEDVVAAAVDVGAIEDEVGTLVDEVETVETAAAEATTGEARRAGTTLMTTTTT